jgi:two-component system, NarL family, invasion response regulator UvrY
VSNNRERLVIRVAVADDHPIVQRGLKDAIGPHSHLELVGTASSFQELVGILPSVIPDVLILDLNGMGSAPLPLMERLKREYPELRVIVFSSFVDLVPEMLKAGAYGYIAKEELDHYLVTAITVVHHGEQFLSPIAASYLARSQGQRGPSELSDQQATAVKYAAQGLRTEAIADRMGIDGRTVVNYITLAKRKTGCGTRLELIDWYRRNYAEGQ